MIKLHISSTTKLGNVNITKLLLKNGANINILTRKGESALHIAAEHGDELIVACLIENGANLNIMDKLFGMTALHHAASNGHELATEILIREGAITDITDYANKKPIQYAIYGRNYTTSLFITLFNDSLCVLITKLFLCCACFLFFFFADHREVADMLREAKHTQTQHAQVDQIVPIRQR